MGFQFPITPARWFKWPDAGDARSTAGTTGAHPVTSGGRRGPSLRAYLVLAVLVCTIDTVNVFTVLTDSMRYGAALPAWQPIVWEATSGVATLVTSFIVYGALRRAPLGGKGGPRTFLLHGAASLLFSGLHFGLMTAARKAIYAAVGLRYRVEWTTWTYEYRKDLLSYLLILGVFRFFTRSRPADEAQSDPSRSLTFDIVDGPTLVRVLLSEVAAVRAAGNYVEFVRSDGRTHLMRQSMRQMEERLGPDGFVRIHRSWLVNSSQVRQIEPTGSGDFQIELRQGTVAPLSRRYPMALAALRKDVREPSS